MSRPPTIDESGRDCRDTLIGSPSYRVALESRMPHVRVLRSILTVAGRRPVGGFRCSPDDPDTQSLAARCRARKLPADDRRAGPCCGRAARSADQQGTRAAGLRGSGRQNVYLHARRPAVRGRRSAGADRHRLRRHDGSRWAGPVASRVGLPPAQEEFKDRRRIVRCVRIPGRRR